jgi:hypothetical protein
MQADEQEAWTMVNKIAGLIEERDALQAERDEARREYESQREYADDQYRKALAAGRMIDVLFLAWNRLAYTGLTWDLLMRNTDWKLVSRLIVYDDGSTDGTLEFLREHLADAPVPAELRESDLRSPVAVMNHFFATATAPFTAKIDNDICVPPGWLKVLHDVMRRNPEVELLGAEAGQTCLPTETIRLGQYDWTPSSHIGGIGLMRTSAFRTRPRLAERGRFGFTEWQNRHNPTRGWVTPDLMIPQLDRVPIEPWASLSAAYVEAGWQRDWPSMIEPWADRYWHWAMPEEETPDETDS